jgi:hypothetical protein
MVLDQQYGTYLVRQSQNKDQGHLKKPHKQQVMMECRSPVSEVRYTIHILVVMSLRISKMQKLCRIACQRLLKGKIGDEKKERQKLHHLGLKMMKNPTLPMII